MRARLADYLDRRSGDRVRSRAEDPSPISGEDAGICLSPRRGKEGQPQWVLLRADSSAGRAPHSHCGGRGFESHSVHQIWPLMGVKSHPGEEHRRD